MRAFSCISYLLTAATSVRAATTVTLLGILQSEDTFTAYTAPISLSIIGVGADGATTYDEQLFNTISNGGVSIGTSTTTYTSAGTAVAYGVPITTTLSPEVETIHGTLVADASLYIYSAHPNPTKSRDFAVLETCSFDGKGSGGCVDKLWLENSTSTFTTSYTGSAIPIFVVTNPNPTSTSLPAGGAKGNGEGNLAGIYVAWSTVVLSVLIGIVLGS